MENQDNEIMNEEQEHIEQPEQETAAAEPDAAVVSPEPVTAEPVPAAQDSEPGAAQTEVQELPAAAQPQKTDPTPGFTIPKADEPKPVKRKGKLWKRVVAAVLALVFVVGSCAVTAEMVNGYWEAYTSDMKEEFYQTTADLENKLAAMEKQMDAIANDGTSVSGSPTGTGDGLTPGQVYAQNVTSVVLVYSVIANGMQYGYSTGSGFILSEDGYILTNYHVVEGGTSFAVITSDNTEYEAVLIGSDSSNDIAVLKIDAQGLNPVSIGSSDALIVGDQVAAIGNPLGELTSTLTVGYVSAKSRYVTTDSNTINMLQTDCAINSGNSGGPLFNMKGEVVGITTAKYSGTSTSGASIEGIGFAIPMDDVSCLIDDIIEYGYVRSAYLGIMVTTQVEPNGAYVQSVESGYCAEKAGLQAGDIIIAVGDREISTMNDLTRAMRELDPDDTTTITVLRGGKELTMEITLDERPREGETSEPVEQMPLPEEGDYDEWYEYFKWFFENQEDEP